MENKEDDDCLGCRLVSGGGLAIGSLYIYRQSLHQKTRFNRYGMLMISTGKIYLFIFLLFSLSINMSKKFLSHFILIAFGLTSAARLFNLFPFNKRSKASPSSTDSRS